MKYYLINNKIMKGGEMPKTHDLMRLNDEFRKVEDKIYNDWLSSLQPCEIDWNHLHHIEMYLTNNMSSYIDFSNPIDVTDIVEDNNGVITFKQPKNIQIGDTIEYTIDNKNTPHLHGKTFRVEVASIDENDCYVYAPYGQDIVPIKQAKLVDSKQPKQVESECEVIESNDYNMDIFINKYIRELPKNWRGEVDLYLGMKNAMLEALSYPDKYTIKRNI